MKSISLEDRIAGDAVHTTTPYPEMPPEPSDLTDFDCNSTLLSGLDQFLASENALSADQFAGAGFAGSPGLDPASMGSKAERKAYNNKLAQRRARARKKTHAQAVEAQLAVASAELEQLQSKQKALEARNSLLEKIVQLEKAQQQPDSVTSAASFVSLQFQLALQHDHHWC